MSDLQRTDDWHAARVGRVTASRMVDVMDVSKRTGEPGVKCKGYTSQLVVERLTGKPFGVYTTYDMQWGIDTEPLALAAYEVMSWSKVKPVGFCVHPDIPNAGASPDGLVDEDGLVEIKCPRTTTFVDYVEGGMPQAHLWQMQWQMACTGRLWCDWVVYDPRLPNGMGYYCERVRRDDETIAVLTDRVKLLLSEVDKRVDALTSALGAATEEDEGEDYDD